MGLMAIVWVYSGGDKYIALLSEKQDVQSKQNKNVTHTEAIWDKVKVGRYPCARAHNNYIGLGTIVYLIRRKANLWIRH